VECFIFRFASVSLPLDFLALLVTYLI
jgi:hypothetical protein